MLFRRAVSVGANETGGRVALPVLEALLKMHRRGIVGPAPVLPNLMEQRIAHSLRAGM